jgi:hypothetical protein
MTRSKDARSMDLANPVAAIPERRVRPAVRGDPLELVRFQPDQGELGAPRCHPPGQARADAAGRPGDQYDFAFDTRAAHGSPPSLV